MWNKSVFSERQCPCNLCVFATFSAMLAISTVWATERLQEISMHGLCVIGISNAVLLTWLTMQCNFNVIFIFMEFAMKLTSPVMLGVYMEAICMHFLWPLNVTWTYVEWTTVFILHTVWTSSRRYQSMDWQHGHQLGDWWQWCSVGFAMFCVFWQDVQECRWWWFQQQWLRFYVACGFFNCKWATWAMATVRKAECAKGENDDQQ